MCISTSDTIIIFSEVNILSPIGAVRSKGPVVQYTQDLTSTGTQFKPMELPQPTAPPVPPSTAPVPPATSTPPAPPAPPLSPQAGDNE